MFFESAIDQTEDRRCPRFLLRFLLSCSFPVLSPFPVQSDLQGKFTLPIHLTGPFLSFPFLSFPFPSYGSPAKGPPQVDLPTQLRYAGSRVRPRFNKGWDIPG